jgi:hypothetical protein
VQRACRCLVKRAVHCGLLPSLKSQGQLAKRQFWSAHVIPSHAGLWTPAEMLTQHCALNYSGRDEVVARLRQTASHKTLHARLCIHAVTLHLLHLIKNHAYYTQKCTSK